MKYYKSGNLKQYLKNHGKLPEEKAIDLTRGIRYASRMSICGKEYAAAEADMNIRSNNQTTENSDKHEVISKANLWSIGLILYEMLYDQYPPGLSDAYCSNCRRLMQRRKQLQLLSQHLLL